MLEEMSPEQFNELIAMDAIEPFGDAKTSHVLALVGAVLANRIGAIMKFVGIQDVKDLEHTHFIPWHKSRKSLTNRPKYVSPNAMAAAVRAAVGG